MNRKKVRAQRFEVADAEAAFASDGLVQPVIVNASFDGQFRTGYEPGRVCQLHRADSRAQIADLPTRLSKMAQRGKSQHIGRRVSPTAAPP